MSARLTLNAEDSRLWESPTFAGHQARLLIRGRANRLAELGRLAVEVWSSVATLPADGGEPEPSRLLCTVQP